MALHDYLPWKRRREQEHPIARLREDIGALFDDFFRDFGLAPFDGTAAFAPSVDVREDEKEVVVSAELPGIDEKDLDVSLIGDSLVIQGQKSEEKEEKEGDYYRRERTFGSFKRVVPLPAEVDHEKADATYKNGLLRIRLPKVGAETSVSRRIKVRRG